MRRYVKLMFMAGLVFVPYAVVPAQRVYTLDECVEAALVNNVRMKNANNDIVAAQHGRKSTFTKYFPSISASGGGFMANKGLLDMTIQPDMEMSILKNGVLGGISATMPVFAGGQIVNGNKLAEVGVTVAQLRHGQSENEVRLTTEQYFWDIVMLKEKLKTVSDIERQIDNIRKDVEAAVSAGVSERNDLLQVKLRRNKTRSDRLELENSLAVSRSLLAQYIGHPSDSIDVAAGFDGMMPPSPAELYRDPEAALVQTNEYRLLQQDVKSSKLQYKMAVGKNMPSVAIGGGYMYDNLMDKDHPFWIGFATVSVPLSGWWGGSHDMKKQKMQVSNAENTLADQSRQLVIRMRNAWNAMNEAYKQVSIAIESIGQSEENLRLYVDYYSAGTCTMSDLLEAQTIYQQSRYMYVENYARYEIKKLEYLQATGR